jgi:Ca2+/Na+ antiporter
MQQFELILKNYKIKSYRLIALLIVFFNLAVYIFLLFSDSHFYNAAASLFLVSAYCLYRFYLAKKTKTRFFMDEFSFFILAGSWVALHNYFIAAGCIFMGVLYYFSLQKFQFVFDNNSIKKLNFPKTEYAWNKFANVLLRDNILTLDFNNNKLIQVEIEDEENIDETEFNAFAQQQLLKFSHPEENVYLN